MTDHKPDIVAFVTARLDEDQAVADAAQEADPAPWTVDAGGTVSTGQRFGHGAGLVTAADEVALWGCEGTDFLCMTAPTAAHVGRNDPARVLAEVAAKRRVLERHKTPSGMGDFYRVCHGCGHDYGSGWTRYLVDDCPELRDLAVVYADHPDYAERWRP